jgi:serine/threonine-protein kinase RsbT
LKKVDEMTPGTLEGLHPGHVEEVMFDVLSGYVGTLVARSIVDCVKESREFAAITLSAGNLPALLEEVQKGVHAFVVEPIRQLECHQMLERRLLDPSMSAAPAPKDATIRIHGEYDIVTARGQCRNLCAELGFSASSQVKVATVVSELARNIVQYAGHGHIELRVLNSGRPGLEIYAEDNGKGIADLDSILAGTYKSKTGMGMGIFGTRRLMDEFEIDSDPASGTRVRARKYVS